jgi:hypothetical protein
MANLPVHQTVVSLLSTPAGDLIDVRGKMYQMETIVGKISVSILA